MVLLQAFPDELYFHWQLQVQILNFREYDLEKDMVVLVGLRKGRKPSEGIKGIEKWFKGKIYYYEDTRTSKVYIPSIRPHLIKKYLKDHPTKVFFYHDQDIIFLKEPKLHEVEEDNFNYVAGQAKGYVYSRYLKSFHKGELFKKMCSLANIDPALVEANDENAGGAQYIIRGTDWRWWDEAEREMEEMYKFLLEFTEEDKKNGIYHIQIWATDLYSLFFKLLKSNFPVRNLKAIDFLWPYDKLERYEKEGIAIMHNAGISSENKNYDQTNSPKFFDKGAYRSKSPFNDDFSYIPSDLGQSKYVAYFKYFKTENIPMERKILAIWNSTYGRTSRKIHPEIVQASLKALKKAADKTKIPIKVITTTWESIPDNPFEELISPWRDLGHMNYLLQMDQQVEMYPEYDFVVIVEHDTLIPEDYFNDIYDNWDYNKYGVTNRNYIGLNTTGYLDVKERHHPMSTMAFATFYFRDLLKQKMEECKKNIGPGYPNGWVCVEPDNKSHLKEFFSKEPMIHMSGKGLGEYYWNFTSHDQVCYESNSNGKVDHPYWGKYLDLIPLFKSYV